MKQEFIDKVNNCSLDFYINLEASGIDDEDGTTYKYKLWSSGPWNKIERIG